MRSGIDDAAPTGPIHHQNQIGADSQGKEVMSAKNQVSDIEPANKPKRRWFGLRKPKMTKAEKKEWKKNLSKRRKIFRKTLQIGGTLAALLIFFVGLKGWTTLSNVIDRAGAGSPLLGDSLSPSQLVGEGDGRVNILMVGIADKGGADTIMIASIDPINNEAALLSVPRDLVVTNPNTGGKFKINAAYSSLNNDAGLLTLEQIIEEILGINIHYYAAADFRGVEKAIDAIGGITLTLDEHVNTLYSPDYGRSLSIGPGVVQLDGEDTLLLGRNRQYPEGDIVRNDYQRDILFAVKERVLSAGTLTNPLKLIQILDSVKNNFRTNLQPSEILTLRDLAEAIPQNKILSYGLSAREGNYLTSGSASLGLGFTFVPKAGDFSEIQSFVRSIFVDGFIKEEAAVVDILNGTTTGGLATERADDLKSFGYIIGKVGNSPKHYSTTSLFDMKGKSPFTKRYLEQRFVLKAKEASKLPEGITSNADFVIILGNDADTTEG